MMRPIDGSGKPASVGIHPKSVLLGYSNRRDTSISQQDVLGYGLL